MIEIPEVSDLDIAFPTNAMNLLPKWDDIPQEYRSKWHDRNMKWCKVVSDWFYQGLKNDQWKPKDGIDQRKALRCIQAILGDWSPSHEHKVAGAAYLLSLWFDDVTYQTRK